MSRVRAVSDVSKTPHSVSLKVLRLSRPRLVEQHSLPGGDGNDVPPMDTRAALSSPGSQLHSNFILSPVLTLPSSFGRAHVGETFSCALCANIEASNPEHTPIISRIQLSAEMQSPSGTVPLELDSSDEKPDSNQATLQRMVKFELREEGNHVLAVTVSYTESPREGNGAERARTFRKLYQFYGSQLLSVRTKTQIHPVESKSGQAVYTLEAQLENLGQDPLVLDNTAVLAAPAFTSRSLNEWDVRERDGSGPTLNPRDILQVAFLLRQKAGPEGEDVQKTTEGRTIVGQLSMQWRSAMGEQGSLSTSYLSVYM